MFTAKRLISCFAVLSLAAGLHCSAQEKVDLETISKIRYEGFHNSKIMEIASGLMDQIGPRLTGSPNMKKANEWTRDKLKDFGLVNSHLEPWEPFGRGWSNEYVNVRMVSPDIATLIAYSKAWAPGTEGTVRGQVVRVNIRGPQDFAKYKGKLAGKIILVGDDPEVKPSVDPLSERLNEKLLADIEHYQIPSERVNPAFREFAQRGRLLRQVSKFFDDE
ncbi:MAG TPA: peptidase M28, partial [Candidatus Angelobacter sp.]|nr:peptidase M28 [Candidatus Angelobacter sp.]